MAIHYKVENRIAEITIDRPEARNAMDSETSVALFEAFDDVRKNPEVWAAIITGAGEKAFSSGADLGTLSGVFGAPSADEGEDSAKSGEVSIPQFLELAEIRKPFIAAINGAALAGGCELALACDIRIAAENATFALFEVKRGFIPGGGGTQRLPRAIPLGLAMEMLMTAKRIDAQEAYRIGLVNRVVPQTELMPAARKLAEEICENAPLAVMAAKEAALTGLELSLPEGLAVESKVLNRVIRTEDVNEGIMSFLEKRKPEWKAK
ncbi:MAG: hypothetical protein GY866_32520 [Proteobacteria bacterium]|nr:hypothetical protein [Pseudomonadota bacterium]